MSKSKAICLMTAIYILTPVWMTYFYIVILYDIFVRGSQSLLCRKDD